MGSIGSSVDDITHHTNGLSITDQPPLEDATRFTPRDCTNLPSQLGLPDELWLTILETPCTFGPEIFNTVMLNLIKNPNITSSHLFRADILYDSSSELLKVPDKDGELRQCLDQEHSDPYGFHRQRVIVRKLIPRNEQLDRLLLQTCHFSTDAYGREGESLVVYIPHVHDAESMPFYHPAVEKLAFLHRWRTASGQAQEYDSSGAMSGSLSVSYLLYPETSVTSKLQRTALKLLQTVHKHGQGQLAGYEKRVHLDQIVPQKRYQDTYARLKAKYGRKLSEQWVEATDPGKHVFEDIGIAAFLIELWRDMYALPMSDEQQTCAGAELGAAGTSNEADARLPFPGFVDIGCGNGILSYILLSEGYDGFSFDARERKTWSIFPEHIQARLQQRLLVPSALQVAGSVDKEHLWHDGMFNKGTFIISNHADELTAWTPLLAYLNDSAFIAIPCCSHDLSGARFRAPPSTKATKSAAEAQDAPLRLPQQMNGDDATHGECIHTECKGAHDSLRLSQAAETGSLKKTMQQKKMASAYSTLCSYVTSLSREVGFVPEKEVLRIPSTRNQSIIGRSRSLSASDQAPRATSLEDRTANIVALVEREIGKPISMVAAAWKSGAEKLAQKPGSGH